MKKAGPHSWATLPEVPVLLALGLAVVMSWPLVFHLDSQTAQVESEDPLYLTWQVAWLGHALLHAPLHLLHTNLYFPYKDGLAFTDVIWGYAPAGVLAAGGPQAALVVHNLLFLFAYAFAFIGAYLLARELGVGRWGGIAAGIAFAYAPWRLEQNGHLHALSSGGIPLALALLVRGYRRGRVRTIVAGWLVAAWQMSLGFTLGLQFAYLLFVVGAVVVLRWWIRARPRPARDVLIASAAGIAAFAAVAALVAQPPLRVHSEYPEAKFPTAEVRFYSPAPRSFLAAPSQSLVWAGATARWRAGLPAPVEQTLFPGVTVVLLALLGLASRAYPPGLRIGLAVGTLVCAALSLGLHGGVTPFRVLTDIAPGWNGVRTPGRLNTLTSLGLALLAAAGLSLAVAAVRRRRRGEAFVALVLVTAIAVEGFGPMSRATPPPVPAGLLAAPTPQLNLPSGDVLDGLYGYWSIGRFPTMANGAGSFDPSQLDDARVISAEFPDLASVRFLRQLGIRSVVLHRDLAAGTAWAGVADRSIAGLRLARQDEGNLVVYTLHR